MKPTNIMLGNVDQASSQSNIFIVRECWSGVHNVYGTLHGMGQK